MKNPLTSTKHILTLSQEEWNPPVETLAIQKLNKLENKVHQLKSKIEMMNPKQQHAVAIQAPRPIVAAIVETEEEKAERINQLVASALLLPAVVGLTWLYFEYFLKNY